MKVSNFLKKNLLIEFFIFLFLFFFLSGLFLKIRTSNEKCPQDMALVKSDGSSFCIDKFEASKSNEFNKIDINNDGDFDDFIGKYSGTIYDNLEFSFEKVDKIEEELALYPFEFSVIRESEIIIPYSQPNKDPWVLVTKYEAETYCRAAEKHLPTSKEWLLAAKGTNDIHFNRPNGNLENCNIWNFGDNPSIPRGSIPASYIFEGAVKTGTSQKCKSKFGAYDMIGNVWEWVSEVVTGDTEKGFTFYSEKNKKSISWPQQGYIKKIDSDTGFPLETSDILENENFNGDYTYTFADSNCSDNNIDGYGCNKKTAKLRGIMRGGSAVNGSAAGIYRADIDDAPSIQFTLLGFRCAKSLD